MNTRIRFFPLLIVAVVFALCAASPHAASADTLTFEGTDDISVETEDASGEIITFDVTAHDSGDTSFDAACTPLSGNLFPLGTTTVSCEAVDGAGATSSVTFAVGVALA